MAITLETKPGTKPRTNKLETKLGTNLAASAWTQDTATRVPHASITKLAHSRGLRPLPPTPKTKNNYGNTSFKFPRRILRIGDTEN